MRLFLSILKYFILIILIIVFFGAVGAGVFTYQKPQQVIEMVGTLIPSVTPIPIKMKGIAVLGDSQSDEYRANDNRGDNFPATTLNWVELLANKRNLNVGEWGEWGEPRRMGYSYNWARTGATARSMIESGQNTGVAEQIKSGQVNVVVIFIGAIDFAPYLTPDGYDAIYNGKLSSAAKKSKVNRVIADIKTAVYTIKDAGDVRILLVKIPDWGNHIGVSLAFPLPEQKAAVTEVLNDANAEIDKLAQDENLLTLDPNQFYNELLRKHESRQLTVDKIPLQKFLLNNDPHNIYLQDGVHIGTVVNGFLANAILEKLNTVLVNKIKPLSEKEIREAAGL